MCGPWDQSHSLMKIAFDHQIFCSQYYGGISRYFVSTALEMQNKGHDLRVFAPFYINNYLSELLNPAVKGRYLKKYPPKTSRIFSELNPYLSRRQIGKWRPNVVHETYFSKTRMAPLNVPTVLTVYDMIHERFPNTLAANDKTTELKRLAVERADHVICISNSTRNDLIELFNVRPEKTSTVYLASDITPALILGESQKGVRPYLLYVGMRSGHKNFSGLIDALVTSPKLKADFDVVAFGGGAFSEAEEQMITAHGFLADQVRHVKGDDTALGRLYACAAAFVYPSLYEGFGLPPLEAMAQGCPVISSNTSSMPEIIGDAGELFPPTDLSAVAKAIEAVVYSESRRADLISKGRERLKEFSWQKCADQTLAIYQGLHG